MITTQRTFIQFPGSEVSCDLTNKRLALAGRRIEHGTVSTKCASRADENGNDVLTIANVYNRTDFRRLVPLKQPLSKPTWRTARWFMLRPRRAWDAARTCETSVMHKTKTGRWLQEL